MKGILHHLGNPAYTCGGRWGPLDFSDNCFCPVKETIEITCYDISCYFDSSNNLWDVGEANAIDQGRSTPRNTHCCAPDMTGT